MSRRRSAVLAVGAFTLTRLCFVAPPPAVHQPYLGWAVGACGSRCPGGSVTSYAARNDATRRAAQVAPEPGGAAGAWRRRVRRQPPGQQRVLREKACCCTRYVPGMLGAVHGMVGCVALSFFAWVPAWCSQCLVCEATRTLMPSTTPC